MIRAFFSAQMKALVGSVFWEREDGTEVECTCVGLKPPLWPDIEDRGPVVKWLRGTINQSEGTINQSEGTINQSEGTI